MIRLILFLVSFGSVKAVSQILVVTNVHHRIIDNKIEIFYSVPKATDSIEVKLLFYKRSNKQFKYSPKFTKGDIGIGVFSGRNKKITWFFKKEPSSLFTGSGFYFKVSASRIKTAEESEP